MINHGIIRNMTIISWSAYYMEILYDNGQTGNIRVRPFDKNTFNLNHHPGLPDLGIYPKILGNCEGEGIFLGIYFFEKNLGIKLGNYRNCVVKFLFSLVCYCLLHFLISESQNMFEGTAQGCKIGSWWLSSLLSCKSF